MQILRVVEFTNCSTHWEAKKKKKITPCSPVEHKTIKLQPALALMY